MTFTDHYKAAEKRIEGLNLRYQPWKSKPVLALAVLALLLAAWTWLRRQNPEQTTR